jgi:hypothetical protein
MSDFYTEHWQFAWLLVLSAWLLLLTGLVFFTDLDDRTPPKPPPGRYERLLWERGKRRSKWIPLDAQEETERGERD